jgi:hypothetical protein
MTRSDVLRARRWRLWPRPVALCGVVLLLLMAAPARAAGVSWLVDRPGDGASDGDLATHSGTLRFALANASAGDVVLFGDVGADTIFVQSTLVIPAGVSVGGARDQADCGSYGAPLANIQDVPLSSLKPVFSLGAGAALHGINIGGGDIAVKIAGDDADICGVGIGIVHDGDGNAIALPPKHAALIVDGARATIRRNYLNGSAVVSTRGSDTRIGDAIGGSDDSNDGIRDAAITVLADANGAARRVTIRDRFPRALHGLVAPGVLGGDDDPTHANHWAQTPNVASARTEDGVTVQISGTANPLSVVDLYLDYLTEIDRRTVMADAAGNFSYSGPLPAGEVRLYAASTLADPAYPARIGSSSEWSGGTAVISSTNPPLLSSLGSTIDLSGVETGPAHAGDILRFNITMVNIGAVDVTNINSTVFQASPTVTLLANSHKITGGNGFVATDSGFSNGTLAPGQTAIYSIEALVNPTDKPALASLSMEVNADGIIATPVRALMRIEPGVVAPAPSPRMWLALALGG